MANYFDYITKYGKKTFKEMPLTEVDNIIFSSIMYANFTGLIPNHGSITYEKAATAYLNTRVEKEVAKLGIAQRNAYKIMKMTYNAPRFRDIKLSHYCYIIDSDMQFSAMTFKLDDGSKFIGFEGTDEMLSGWKEDFTMPFKFPVDAHRYAMHYAKENISIFDKDVYLGGHSKGGNLALVASMYVCRPLRNKIKRIYSNDGPGLRKQEFSSKQYARICDRFVHIIPNYSMVGVSLTSGEHQVVLSTKKNILSHDAATWVVEGTKFKSAKLSEKSREIERHLAYCFERIPAETLERVICTVFSSAYKAGYSRTIEIFNARAAFRILKELRCVDAEERKLLIHTAQIVAQEFLRK